jgi:hypothetical protein
MKELIDLTMSKLLGAEVEVIKDPLGLKPDATLMDFHEAVWRNPSLSIATRQRSGIALLQFLYPKLAVVGTVLDRPDMAQRLDKAIERTTKARTGQAIMNGTRLIEEKPEPFRRRI